MSYFEQDRCIAPERAALQDERIHLVHRGDGSRLTGELDEPVRQGSGGLLAPLNAHVNYLSIRGEGILDILLAAEDRQVPQEQGVIGSRSGCQLSILWHCNNEINSR